MSSDKQAERSRKTRAKIVAAACELFVEKGYGATSLQDVATRAGVAVQTIYFVFGAKRALFKDVVDTTIAGDAEPVETMGRDWFRRAVAAPTAAEHVRLHVRGTRPVMDRVAPIIPVIAAATATDPEIPALWPDRDPRYTVLHTTAKSLVTKPGARTGVSARHAADVLYGVLSPELYLVFTRERGWSPAKWEKWARETLLQQLCEAAGS
ncbi:TetR/AcrR family transcriptional regulator [Amycolatopsis echigonensis]|uniref:TetR family transcriptional regulator n=1 Tax=Amycolatopsis echigonensis TaxID=2576905 RepID=A0A2N3WUX5_9PSEU|nr:MULTISPECIES: TetR/AcrR family transcriptional regulator [Amycolatopsis]PKV97654.1 TetR family transcriptional regulator [Amycolatopsis niigatensis]